MRPRALKVRNVISGRSRCNETNMAMHATCEHCSSRGVCAIPTTISLAWRARICM